jgi:hypothetical protein
VTEKISIRMTGGRAKVIKPDEYPVIAAGTDRFYDAAGEPSWTVLIRVRKGTSPDGQIIVYGAYRMISRDGLEYYVFSGYLLSGHEDPIKGVDAVAQALMRLIGRYRSPPVNYRQQIRDAAARCEDDLFLHDFHSRE